MSSSASSGSVLDSKCKVCFCPGTRVVPFKGSADATIRADLRCLYAHKLSTTAVRYCAKSYFCRLFVPHHARPDTGDERGDLRAGQREQLSGKIVA